MGAFLFTLIAISRFTYQSSAPCSDILFTNICSFLAFSLLDIG